MTPPPPLGKICLFGFFPKGGGGEEGVMSESKLFEKLFCSVHVWTSFLIELRHFSGKGEGLPDSKDDEEL